MVLRGIVSHARRHIKTLSFFVKIGNLGKINWRSVQQVVEMLFLKVRSRFGGFMATALCFMAEKRVKRWGA